MRLFRDIKEKAAQIERRVDQRLAAFAQGGTAALHPLELHNAILEEIENQVTAGPRGSHLFPYDDVRLEILSIDARQAAALEAMFESAGGLEAEIRRRLSQRDCDVPRDLSSSVVRVTERTVHWSRDAVYRLTFRRSDPDAHPHRRPAVGNLRIASESGETAREYRLGHGRTDIGRTAEVRDRAGRLVRRNAICIAEERDSQSTVSRCHAHIDGSRVRDESFEYTLYDDGSTYGTRVVRDGKTIAVHRGSIGVRLRDGDELYFGSARAMFALITA